MWRASRQVFTFHTPASVNTGLHRQILDQDSYFCIHHTIGTPPLWQTNKQQNCIIVLLYITELSRCHLPPTPHASTPAANPCAVTSLSKSTTDGPANRLTLQTQWLRPRISDFFSPPLPFPAPSYLFSLQRQLAMCGRHPQILVIHSLSLSCLIWKQFLHTISLEHYNNTDNRVEVRA